MTKEEIIAIYIEVSNKLCNGTEWCWSGVDEPLQLFATLVAEHEREACIAHAMTSAEKAIDVAIKIEREACAVICETYWNRPNNGMSTEEEVYGSVTAELIRARGQANG